MGMDVGSQAVERMDVTDQAAVGMDVTDQAAVGMDVTDQAAEGMDVCLVVLGTWRSDVKPCLMGIFLQEISLNK